MHLRPLQRNDVPHALQLIRKNYPGRPVYIRRARHELNAMFQKGVVVPRYLAAIEKEKLVGFGGVTGSWMDYDVFTLFWVNVEPHEQGKGVGTRMVRSLLTVARSHGAKYVLITTTRPSFYRRLGFRTLAHLQRPYVLMIKKLSSI